MSYNSKGDLIEDAQIYGDSIAYLFIFENGDLVKEVRKIDISFNDFDGRLEIDSKLNTCKYNSFKNLDSCVHYYTVFDEKMDEMLKDILEKNKPSCRSPLSNSYSSTTSAIIELAKLSATYTNK